MKTLSNLAERAWYYGAIWFWPLLIIFWPLSIVFACLAAKRRAYLQRKQIQLPVPVIVVGNISVGGTGKTPLLCTLAMELVQRGKSVGIISRGYGGSYDGQPRMVQPTDNADIVGDEPLLLARLTGCAVVIAHKRLDAVQYLIAKTPLDIILSDDGMQHYALPRTVEIAVLDGVRGIGNGFCLPAGPLREPVSRLRDVDFVVVNEKTEHGKLTRTFHERQLVTELLPQHWVAVASGAMLELQQLHGRVHAVAGIGNPQRFFDTLRGLGLDVIEHPFPDHYGFTYEDICFSDGLPVVMTEKDAVKCAGFSIDNCYALHVKMILPDVWIEKLLDTIDKNFRRSL